MNRRKFLYLGAVGITTTVAGCTGSEDDDSEENGESDSDDDENGESSEVLYDESDKEDMLLTEDDFDDDLNRDEEFNEHYDVSFVSDDESIVVMVFIEIEDTVEEAEDSFEKSKAGTADPNEYPIADEAWWAIDEPVATTMFRHSNAVAQVAAMRNGSADQNRSQTYAEEMYESW